MRQSRAVGEVGCVRIAPALYLHSANFFPQSRILISTSRQEEYDRYSRHIRAVEGPADNPATGADPSGQAIRRCL